MAILSPLSGLNVIKTGTSATSPLYDMSRLRMRADTYYADMKSRYDQVVGKTEAELTAMGITFSDGSYFKDGVAWLSKNSIEEITGKYKPLMDASGNYAYPLNIPQDIMLTVVNQYSSTLSKDEMIKLATSAYQKTGNTFTDSTIKTAVETASKETAQANPITGAKIEQANATLTNKAKSFLSKYGVWIIGGVVVLIAGIILLPKSKNN